MDAQLLLVLAVVLGILVTLSMTRIAADAVLLAALAALLAIPVPTDNGWVVGVLTPAEALAGFSNAGMLTVAALFVVVAGLRETGGIDRIAGTLLGRPAGERSALLRVILPVGTMSAFLNNTPVVAMMIPAVQDWSRRLKLSPSKLMIPLSYAAILGGTCSLIGTSTNLVVAGLVLTHTDLEPLGMFDITRVGLPAALIGAGFLVIVGPWLLRARANHMGVRAEHREYAMELVIPKGSAMSGKTIEQAGLRSLPGCFLIEVERDGDYLRAVGPEQVLRAGDHLLFVGVVDAIRDLANTRGLELATDQVFKLDSPRFKRRLAEAVVAPGSALAGRTIRESNFRNRFNGVVIAVARNGERLRGRLGDIRLMGGDLLLVEADTSFARRVGASRDFLLIRQLEDSAPRRHSRALVALGILLTMVGLATFEVYPMFVAALLAAGAMVVTRCCTLTEARQNIDWTVLIVIAAALGLGTALEKTGVAQLLAGGVLSVAGPHPWLALIAIYAVTSLLTEVITNNAAVALVFPIAQAAAAGLDVNFMPFVIALMMAGSASFATPLGYQTNLMVYGPGQYTFADFLRIGVPMNILMGIATVSITPLLFPF